MKKLIFYFILLLSFTHETLKAQVTAAFTASDTVICAGDSVFFTDQSTSIPPAFIWLWSLTGANPAFSSGQNPKVKYDSAGTFDVTLIVCNPTCDTLIKTVYITVNPNPVADFIASPDSGCHPLTISFTNLSTDACCYMWDFGDGSPIDTTVNPTHTFFNTSAIVDTVYCVTLIAMSVDSCTDTITKCVVVHPKPVIDSFTVTPFGCTPLCDPLCVTATGATTYYWDFGDFTFDSSLTDTCLIHCYTNFTASPVLYNPVIIVENVYGCTDTATASVTVFPEVTALFAVLPDIVGCDPFTVNFQNFSIGAIAYEWDFGDGATSTLMDPVYTFTNPACLTDTIYTVQLIATAVIAICKDTATQQIVVHPKPVAAFTLDTADGCNPLTVTITNLASCYDTLYWDYGDGTPIDTTTAGTLIHTYVNFTDTTICYILSLIAVTQYGCADTLTDTICVYPEVITGFFVSDNVGCHPLTVSFFSFSFGADTCYLNFGDGSPLDTTQNPTHTFVNTSLTSDTVYVVELICVSQFGCSSDTARDTILVHPKPFASFVVDTNEGCSPLTVTITNLSAGYDSLIWDYGDGFTDTTTVGIHTYLYVNTTDTTVCYTLRLIAINQYGCTDTFSVLICVHPEISADFTQIPPDTIGCHPFTVCFLNLSLGEDFYLWDFGDGFTDSIENPCHTFTNTGSIDSCYITQLITVSAFGCGSDTADQVICVLASPNVSAAPSAPSICAGDSVALSTSGADTYTWSPSSGLSDSTGASVVAFPTTTTTYTVIGEFINGCNDTATVTVNVLASFPSAGFTGDITSGCGSLTVNFTNTSTDATAYSWSFPGGTPSSDTVTNPTVSYSAPGIYNVELIAFGCGANDTVTSTGYISVNPVPAAGFASIGICLGAITQFIDSSIVSSGSIAGWDWDFGDGDTGTMQNPAHIYSSCGIYPVQLIVSSDSGCQDTAIGLATVSCNPAANFNFVNVCFGDSIFFTDASSAIPDSLIAWNWNFGDGTQEFVQNPLPHFYSDSAGSYVVQLVVETDKGCRDTIEKAVTVFPVPQAGFIATNACFGDSTVFYAMTTILTGTATSNWNFGDSFTGTGDTVSHLYNSAGAYTVQLISITPMGCSDTSDMVVVVNPKPAGSFSSDKDTADLAISGMVNFTDSTTGSISWDWDFGDGTGTDSIQNPSYTYTATGTFIVQLVVTDNNGCIDTVEATIIVINTTGINHQSLIFNHEFKVYPNPANGTLIIESDGIEIKRIKLFNSLGQIVLNAEAKGMMQKLDISKLTEGNYIVRIETEKGVVSKNIDITR